MLGVDFVAELQDKKERFAELLREYMRQENLTGRQLAMRLKLAQPTVLSYLDAISMPSEETRRKIAPILGLTVTELNAKLEGAPVSSEIPVEIIKQEIRAMSRADFAEVAQVVFDRLLIEADLLRTSP